MFATRATISITAAVIAGLAASCGGTSSSVRPDDMSATGHLRKAEQLEEQAKAHEEQYDPDAVATRESRVYANQQEEYNPTEEHLEKAEQLRQLAEEHREAAAELREYEDDQCAQISADTRAQCPLLDRITEVEDIRGGARIHFADGVDVAGARTHVQCHLAYARSHGREGMDQCPMYVEGSRSDEGPEGTVDLVTTDPAQVAELRRRARAHLPH